MCKSLLEEFKQSCKIEIGKNTIDKLSPTGALSLIRKNTKILEEFKVENIKEIDKFEDNSVEVTNDIIGSLDFPKENITPLKFIFHELIGNIYDHSQFRRSYVMGKSYKHYCDFSFIDDGICISNSFKNANFKFLNDCDAIIKAINGLSTKNEYNFIERGTGLNNSINITINGANGSVLIVSGKGLVYINQKDIFAHKLEESFSGTMISLRLNLDKKIDIYKYLKQIEYKYNF